MLHRRTKPQRALLLMGLLGALAGCISQSHFDQKIEELKEALANCGHCGAQCCSGPINGDQFLGSWQFTDDCNKTGHDPHGVAGVIKIQRKPASPGRYQIKVISGFLPQPTPTGLLEAWEALEFSPCEPGAGCSVAARTELNVGESCISPNPNADRLVAVGQLDPEHPEDTHEIVILMTLRNGVSTPVIRFGHDGASELHRGWLH